MMMSILPTAADDQTEGLFEGGGRLSVEKLLALGSSVIYTDRMNVTSLGALPNSMPIEKAGGGERMPRNTKISDILRDCGFIEGRGMGIRRKVIPLTVEATGHEPLFEATEDYFKMTLPKSKSGTATSSSVHP